MSVYYEGEEVYVTNPDNPRYSGRGKFVCEVDGYYKVEFPSKTKRKKESLFEHHQVVSIAAETLIDAYYNKKH